MEKDNEYTAADLSPELVNEIKSLEERLSEEAKKKVVVIAYEEE
jgi:ABC-type histidine transport system ATPase subunit